jgi:protein-disulfide isomerase
MKNHSKRLSLILIGIVTSASLTWADTNSSGSGCAIAGPKNAPLTIEEYADFECPYCVRGANTIKQALKEYPGKIKLIYRNMPLPFHSHAVAAAKAFSAVCLQSPQLAMTFHNELFANQEELQKKGEAYLFEVANKIGVNVERMKQDMDGPEVAKSLSEDQQAAEAHGFKGTPSFLIGSEPVVGAMPYSEIKKVIERQLNQ